jgi:hypothetical protein
MFCLHITGAAALLIWAVRLIHTGVERRFAAPMRIWLRHSAKNRLLAAGTGMCPERSCAIRRRLNSQPVDATKSVVL